MNNELLEKLRAVLKEELKPINGRLDNIDQNLEEHNKRFDKIDQTLEEHNKHFDKIDQTLEEHNKRFDKIEQNLEEHNMRFDKIDQTMEEHNKRFDTFDHDFKELKDGQERLQKNIIKSLGDYTDKIVLHVDNKTEALNKRTFAVETEIQRLTRQ